MKKIEKFSDFQNILLAMLYFTDDLCRKNDIKYTVMDGTLLGAVREGNMIAWDGDVDIALTHKEFEKLKKAFANYTGRYYLSYFPDHFYTKGKYYGLTHARIIDKKASNPMLCIDVVTIDFLGDDYQAALDTVEEYIKINYAAERSISFHLPSVKKNKPFGVNFRNVLVTLLYPFFLLLSKILTPKFKKRYSKFIKEKISYGEDSKYYTIEPYFNRFGVEENDILKNGYIDLPFSSFKVMAVANYETYLRKTYGDYRQLPPVEKRVPFPSEKELLNCKIEMDDELSSLLNRIKGENKHD